MEGLAGVALVSDQEEPELGALAPRNLGAAEQDPATGVFLKKAQLGTVVEVATANRTYRLAREADDTAFISGHPVYCPKPIRVELHGTRWLDKSLTDCYVAPGMRLQFVTPSGRSILTSRIRSVRVVSD